jgi:hypothetical protein
MPVKFSQYINRTVLVSIPALFGDGKCRAYTLRGANANGLWLESDGLSQRLLAGDRQSYVLAGRGAFVPFEHIAGVFLVAEPPAPQPAPGKDVKPPAAPAARAKTQPPAKAPKAR